MLFLCLHWVARGQTDYEYRYWFDGQIETSQQGTSGDAAWDMQIDVSALAEGMHFLHYQVTVSDTLHSPTQTAFFMKNPAGHESYTCFCYIDNALCHQQDVSADGGPIDWNLDVSTLSSDKLHAMLLLVKTPTGIVVSTQQAFFWRAKTTTELKEMTCFYSLDGGKTLVEGGVFQEKGFSFDADIQALDAGLHQLLCLLVDKEGTVVRTCSQYFVKPHNYVSYSYWINDEVSTMRPTKVNIANPIQLLEVGSYPLRSTDFHFEVDGGIPYVYAKNDLHVRFQNNGGEQVEESFTYIDAASKLKVESRGTLQPGEKHTDKTPEANVIHWYQVNASPGDSLVFSVSQEASLEVFSPTGMKLIDAEGEEVSETSCLVSENGICYVALHDVKDAADEMSIELKALKSATNIEAVATGSLVDVYNLQGVCIYSRVSMQTIMQELPRGIYIIRGKKFVIR